MHDQVLKAASMPAHLPVTRRCRWRGAVPYDTELFSSAADLPWEMWDRVAGDDLFLQGRYLRALAAKDGGAVDSRLAVFRDGGQPVGVASFQIVELVGPPIAPLLERRGSLFTFLAKRWRWVREPLALKILVCGDAFLTGQRGFAWRPGTHVERAMRSLDLAAKAICADLGASDALAGFLVKDFGADHADLGGRLMEAAYTEIETEPNMVLELEPRWRSFDDYLHALSSKYRVKAKRAYAKSKGLVVRELSLADCDQHLGRMRSLLEGVRSHARYRLGRLDVAALRSLRSNLGDQLLLRGYFLGDDLVGFASGFVVGATLEAHLVGFDYTHNREHSIYPRMLYDYLEAAIRRGLGRVSFGRTAAEIKSTLGATAVATRCYFRHRNGTLNRFLPAVSRRVRAPAFHEHKAFKGDGHPKSPVLSSP